jgi:hypothetical protein
LSIFAVAIWHVQTLLSDLLSDRWLHDREQLFGCGGRLKRWIVRNFGDLIDEILRCLGNSRQTNRASVL